jgi:hypothetical protein
MLRRNVDVYHSTLRNISDELVSHLETSSPSAVILTYYQGADKPLARPTYRCILFDGENISFDASLVIYIYIYIYIYIVRILLQL